MSKVFNFLFGQYSYRMMIFVNGNVELLICTLLFCWYFKRKKLFPLRLILTLLASLGVTFLLAMMRTHYPNLATRFIATIIQNALTLALIFVCFEENVSEKLMCWCGSIAAQQATSAGMSFIYAGFGIDYLQTISFFPIANETRDWLIYYALHIALYVLCALVFSRRKRTQSDKTSLRNIAILSVFTLLFVSMLANVNREYENTSYITRMIIQALFLACFCFVLVLRTGIFTQSRIKHELEIMDQMLYEEKKQYENVKNNIDIINMKCHDLKHKLADLEGKLTQQEIDALKSAIEIYDSNIRTGNEILDVLLYEKKLVCDKENIQLSCMADGACLAFLSSSHLYSLLGNALDNAIEAVRAVPDPDKRMISLTVNKEALTQIHVSNYYDGDIKISEGIPQTSKPDTTHHGFGTKSIRYIASLYGGKTTFTASSGMFHLDILFPPESE